MFALFVKNLVLFVGVHHKCISEKRFRVHSGFNEELATDLVRIFRSIVGHQP